MQRRVFLATIGSALLASQSAQAWEDDRPRSFKLKYAPHFGMFRHLAGDDPVDQLKFAADQGFTAWEDNGMIGRPVAEQERIGESMQQLGMEWGVISALRGVWNGVNFAGDDRKSRDVILKAMRSAVDVAERVQAKRMVVVPGLLDPKLPMDYQTANCIDLLRQCCDIVEPRGLVIVLEPLNRLTNHPGVFLFSAPQAYLLCRAVNRPSCKILFDIYHQQISEGNLLPNIDRCWDEIAYFQSADNPGRNEPGTGEINYRNIFAHLYEKGYRGAVGMEHGNAQDGAAGERAVIAAYRAADDFSSQSD
jgi:hydroxypyruvate isomerase